MKELQEYQDMYERIELFYSNSAKLSPSDKKIAERWELAFSLLQKERIRSVAVKKLMAIESRKGDNLSRAQAYRDMKSAERLFVPLLKYSKELLRHTMIESAYKDLQKVEFRLRNQNLTNKDLTSLLLIKDKIESRLIDITGIGEDNPDMPDFSKLEMHQYNITVPPQYIAMLEKIMKSGVVDMSDYIPADFDPFEIVEDNAENSGDSL